MNTPPSSPPESTGLDREVAGDINESLGPTIAGERDIPSVNRRRANDGGPSGAQKLIGIVFAVLALTAVAWYYAPQLTGKQKQAKAPPTKVDLAPAAAEQAREPTGKSPTEVLAEVQAEQERKARAERPPPVIGPIPLDDANAPPPPGVTARGGTPGTNREASAEERRRKEAQDLLDKRRRAPLLAYGDESRGGRTAARNGAAGDNPSTTTRPAMTQEEANAIAERIASGQRGGGDFGGGGSLVPTATGAGGSGAGSRGIAPSAANQQRDRPAGELEAKLTPTPVAMVQAAMLPDRDLLLTQGTFIDCTLETVLDSTVPGFTRCVTTRNIYSNSGRVILLERGTKIIGQYQGGIKQGQARIFVLWTRAETPHGVIIELASPGTDPLGAAGLPGDVDTKFWARFGGALLLSIIQDAFDVAKAEAGANSITANTNNTQEASKDAAGIALENSINIPPVLYKNQGDRINVLIAQDLDFSSVYALRLADN